MPGVESFMILGINVEWSDLVFFCNIRRLDTRAMERAIYSESQIVPADWVIATSLYGNDEHKLRFKPFSQQYIEYVEEKKHIFCILGCSRSSMTALYDVRRNTRAEQAFLRVVLGIILMKEIFFEVSFFVGKEAS